MRTQTVGVGRICVVIVGIFALLGMSGCSARPSTAKSSEALKVVASTTQICDYVTQLASGGKDLAFTRTSADGKREELGADDSDAVTRIDLTCLLAPNASAHEHEMTFAQSEALAHADLFLVSGVDLEHFLDDAVEATGFRGKMVVTSGVLTAADLDNLQEQKEKEKDLPYVIDRGDAAVNVEKWPFPPEAGESEPEFRFDPHVWTSPKLAVVQVENIGEALVEAVPEGAEVLRSHVDAYVKKLMLLDSWVKDSIDTVPTQNRVLFTSHDAFGYFSRDYGVNFRGAALSDFNSQQDATATKIQETVDAVRESGAVAIFAENSNNPKSVEKVATLSGVRAIVGDEALYGDSLGEPGSDGETYIGSILHNVTNLTVAWGGTVAPIPDELTSLVPRDVIK